MRWFFNILGVTVAVLIVAAAIGIGFLVYKGHGIDAESKAYVDSAVPAITANWNQEELLKRATPELRNSIRPGQLTALFEAFSRLGTLVTYEGATGQANMTYFTGTGGAVTATYVAKAKYQNGEATIRIVLLKQDGQWFIHNLHIDSPAFGPNSPAPQRT